MRGSDMARQLDQYAFPDAAFTIKILLVADDPSEESRIRSIIESVAGEIKCVSTIDEVWTALCDGGFDVIMVDRHLGGWLSAHACNTLRARAGPIPVVGLINEDCVLDLHDGIESGLMGVYYKDQIDIHLVRRLAQLAHLEGVGDTRGVARLGATNRHQIAAACSAASILPSAAVNFRPR